MSKTRSAGAVACAAIAAAAFAAATDELPPKFQCLPPDNPWHFDVSKFKVHPDSDKIVASIGADRPLHADFGTKYGIPYCVVPGTQKKVPVEFEYKDESDKGPYPIPDDAPVEGGAESDGDRHVLVIDRDKLMLYETWKSVRDSKGWKAGSGAVFDLKSNDLRPAGWTSADAAGLPIFPGLVRYDEVARGEIDHAIRFTVRRSRKAYWFPARHQAGHGDDPSLPPMGLRVRLKADFDVKPFPKEAQVVLRAAKKYGLIVADHVGASSSGATARGDVAERPMMQPSRKRTARAGHGSDWFISGAPDKRWDDDALHALSRVKGKDFEVVESVDEHGKAILPGKK